MVGTSVKSALTREGIVAINRIARISMLQIALFLYPDFLMMNQYLQGMILYPEEFIVSVENDVKRFREFNVYCSVLVVLVSFVVCVYLLGCVKRYEAWGAWFCILYFSVWQLFLESRESWYFSDHCLFIFIPIYHDF